MTDRRLTSGSGTRCESDGTRPSNDQIAPTDGDANVVDEMVTLYEDGEASIRYRDGPAEAGDEYDSSHETDYLLLSPENARRLTEAVSRDKASHPGPSDTKEAPTKHRPERSEEE